MTDTVYPSGVQAALDAGLASADPTPVDPGTVYSVALPANAVHQLVDTEPYAAKPRRLRGTYRPATIDALILVVDRFKDPDETTLWVHPTSGRVAAVFNDNDGHNHDGGWRDHKAELQLQLTDEWKHWLSQDGQRVNQHAFAEHIEEGLSEIVSPPAADMLELAQTIQAIQSANFRSAIRLDNGQIQAKYEETIDTKAGQSGQLTIPEAFTLGLQPFLGGARYELTARFRYRIANGNLTMGYKLERPEAALRTALADVAEQLSIRFADLPVVVGEPT